MNKIVIPLNGLPTLNEHEEAARGNKYKAARFKENATHLCFMYIRQAINKGFKINKLPVDLEFTWYVKDKRKDKDNIAFAKKYIFDGMVNASLIENDGWKQIGNWIEKFEVDKFERVEIRELGGK